jgi:hypothetical protein
VLISGEVQDTSCHCATAIKNYLLPDPDEGFVEFGINTLNVIYRQLLVQHLFVEWHCESTVNKFTMIQSLKI